MSFKDNLRRFRKQKGFTQATLAAKLGITRAAVGSYEEGRAEPPFSLLVRICTLLEVPTDAVLSAQEPLYNETYIRGEKLRLLTITVGQESLQQNAVLVPLKAAAGYLNGYAEPSFVADLPTVNLSLSVFRNLGTLRLFEIEGDSMPPVPQGSYVIGAFLQDWTRLKGNAACIVVSKLEGIVFKYVQYTKGQLRLKSSNSLYKTFVIDTTDVIEVWLAKGYISPNIPLLHNISD